LQDKRKLHFTGAEEFPDLFHAVEKKPVDDLERFVFLKRLLEVGFQPFRAAFDDVTL
jgi:hypothetical protein